MLPWYTPIFHGDDQRNDIYHDLTSTGGVNSQREYVNPNVGPLQGETLNESKAYGFDMRWGSYFFVESDMNTYYRHKDVNSTDTSTEYFPKETNNATRLESWFPFLGNIQDYNTQYSKENDLKTYFPVGSTSKIITKFETRTIYSDQAAGDDILDAYRSYSVNNFYDLPANTGPIWDSFIHMDTLYLHTPKSLWRTFAEPAATLKGGNIDDIVLGTGNLFSRPSREMVTEYGGYAGSISQFGGTHSQFGYMFPDVLQGKVFLLTTDNLKTDNLKEISEKGLYTFFHKNLSKNIDLTKINTEESILIDNPYNGIGITSGYDYKLKRIIVSQVSNGFTYSYFPSMDSWYEHSYIPDKIISFDNRVFFFKDGVTHEMNVGDKCSYFDTIYDSNVSYVSNKQHNQSKTFTNIQIWSETKDNGLKIKNDNFKDLQIYNDISNSGVQSIVTSDGFNEVSEGEIRIKLVNDKYNISLPRDYVKDNSLDLTDPDNMFEPIGTITPLDIADFTRERIKGDHAVIKMTYDNTNSYEFVLKYIITIFNLNKR